MRQETTESVLWDEAGEQKVAASYELGWRGTERVIRPLFVETRETYHPLDRPTLPEELAGIADQDEWAVLDFVSRNGLLTEDYEEPVSYIWREARAVRLVLALLRVLDVAKGNDAEIDARLTELIGPDVVQRVLSPVKPPWVKATWRESVPTSEPEPYTNFLYPENRPGDYWQWPPDTRLEWDRRRERDHFGFLTGLGGRPPAKLEPGDQDTRAAVARFLIRDVLNAPRRVRIEEMDRRFRGSVVRRLVAVREGRLVSVTSSMPLINAIYWQLGDLATTGGHTIRICPECGHFFVARDPRRMFCNPPAGEKHRESICGLRYRTKRQRQRTREGGHP